MPLNFGGLEGYTKSVDPTRLQRTLKFSGLHQGITPGNRGRLPQVKWPCSPEIWWCWKELFACWRKADDARPFRGCWEPWTGPWDLPWAHGACHGPMWRAPFAQPLNSVEALALPQLAKLGRGGGTTSVRALKSRPLQNRLHFILIHLLQLLHVFFFSFFK